MKKLLCLTCLSLFTISFSQELVLITFKDKPLSSHYLSNPIEMLTQKALDRRSKYAISLSDTDVPIHTDYIKAIKDLGIPVIASSRWFNGVFIEINEAQKTQISALSCVSGIESFVKNTSPGKQAKQPEILFSYPKPLYGVTDTQIEQIGLDHLHNLGYKGNGITIAIIDAGFPGVNTIPAFDYIRTRNQIKGGYDFVNDDVTIYSGNGHGTRVLSTIGGYVSDLYTGTAIDADFYLYITEKDGVEIPEEEVWWIAAAEKADSLGVDIINSSLGYSSFDDPRYNYTVSDLNGTTSFISRGAQTAAEKGIFVVVAAGNEGNSSWKKISVPADAKDVFSIGAVNAGGISALFSSYGPSADGRIKPDISAMGESASLVGEWGGISSGNGTSFSSPIIAGAVACLLQAFPNTPLSLLKQKIKESASLYLSPTDQQGYGVPNFTSVLGSLSTDEVEITPDAALTIYPNPVEDLLYIDLISGKSGDMKVQFFTYDGKWLHSWEEPVQSGKNHIPVLIPYLLRIHHTLIMKLKTPDGKNFSKKVVLFK
jgi:subtilisin family serine protease